MLRRRVHRHRRCAVDGWRLGGAVDTSRNSRLRIGILGTARVARGFIAGVAPSESVRVIAVASRSMATAQRFAQDNGVERAFGSYDELLADPQIDAIYNPLPNTLHAPWSIRALEAGKHVLCEKPLATSSVEVRAMFAAARQHGLMLVEGFPYRSQPQTLKLQQLLSSGAIGRVQTMQAAMGFMLTDSANIRLDPRLGGGALMDVGIYPVSLVRLVAGQRPARVQACANWHASGVEQTITASLEHASGVLAQVSASFATGLHRQALIAGAAGVIQTSFANHLALDRPASLQLKRGTSSDALYQDVELPGGNGFRAEAEAFERLIRLGAGHWNGASADESLDIMLTIEAILESARLRRPVDIQPPAPLP